MIKCGVCGSENEAAALFCGTCGSPLAPADAKAIAEEAAKTAPVETPTGDDAVVPGKGGARRDLGTGGTGSRAEPAGTEVTPVPVEPITDSETEPGGPTITCGVCGTVNDATRTYCRRCANELKPAPPPPPPPPPPAPRRKISPVALGLGAAAAVVAIALIGILLLGGGNEPVASGSPTGQPSGSAGPTAAGSSSGPSAGPSQPAFAEAEITGQIAFSRCPKGGGTCVIAVRPADASANARRLTATTGKSALDPALSPDGKHVLYTVEPGLRDLTISTKKWVQHSNGSGDANAFWAPDGKTITFAGHRTRDPGSADADLEVRIDGATSGDSTPLTNNDIVDHDPTFTPDGKFIVWVQGEGDERELKMIEIASGDVTDLTTDAFADEDPAVSPLGGQLVFASKRGSGGEYDLFLLDIASHQVTPLPTMPGNERDPAWSPGGRFIVFSGGTQGSEDLFILDLADSSITPYTTGGDADLSPSWSIGKG